MWSPHITYAFVKTLGCSLQADGWQGPIAQDKAYTSH